MSNEQIAKIKHKAFAKEFLSNGFDKVKAYKKVYPGVTDKTAATNSGILINKEIVQQEIEWKLDSLTPESVLRRIDAIAGNARRESDKLKALELLGKYLSLFKTEQETTHKLDIDLNLLRNRILEQKNRVKTIPGNGTLADTSKEAITITNDKSICYDSTLTDNVSVTEGNAAAGGTVEAPQGV